MQASFKLNLLSVVFMAAVATTTTTITSAESGERMRIAALAASDAMTHAKAGELGKLRGDSDGLTSLHPIMNEIREWLKTSTLPGVFMNMQSRTRTAPRGYVRVTSHCYDGHFTSGVDVCIPFEPKVDNAGCNQTRRIRPHTYTVTFKGAIQLDGPVMMRLDLMGLTNEQLGIYVVGQCSGYVHKHHPNSIEMKTRLAMCYHRGLDYGAFECVPSPPTPVCPHDSLFLQFMTSRSPSIRATMAS